MKHDLRVDAYIQKSAAFAQPILTHIRELVHRACPEVTETIKWGFPNFEYKGLLCSMAAFKQHCSFGFWKAALLTDPHRILIPQGETAMGHFGKIKSIADLPEEAILCDYIWEAARLNAEDKKLTAKARPAGIKELNVPDDVAEALRENEKAKKTFENFSYSHKKEYLTWITDAKSEATRYKRLATAIEWMAEGKVRNWKYIKN